jgi:segregation and condensation protein A
MSDTFQIKTEIFEGPLDLLLSLIEKKKLFINDISLAKVADDYVSYLQNRTNFPIAESADFLVVASTLLLIKSRSLIPELDLTTDEQQDIDDLERRLRVYQRIKELSLHIKKAFGRNVIFYPESRPRPIVFSPDSTMTKNSINQAVWSVIRALPKVQNIPKAMVKKVISLEEMITNLTSRIQSSIKLSFRDFAKVGKEEKVNVIISFLAMLELVKQGVVSVRQDEHFSDIEIETGEPGLPNYC